jgi:hypothetical protein
VVTAIVPPPVISAVRAPVAIKPRSPERPVATASTVSPERPPVAPEMGPPGLAVPLADLDDLGTARCPRQLMHWPATGFVR